MIGAKNGTPEGNRTPNLLLRRQTLYPLSYWRTLSTWIYHNQALLARGFLVWQGYCKVSFLHTLQNQWIHPSANRFKTQFIGLGCGIFQPTWVGLRLNSRWMPAPGTGVSIGGLCNSPASLVWQCHCKVGEGCPTLRAVSEAKKLLLNRRPFDYTQ